MADEPELTFEQKRARVAKPEGGGQFFKDENGREVRLTISELVQSMADPRVVVLALRGIDETDDAGRNAVMQ
jgi:hypothetical protein